MKRPACFHRQTGACRSCGLAVSQPSRGREEPVETTDAFRPTGGGRGAESGPSLSPTARATDSQPPDQRPASEAINSDSPDRCPVTEAINFQPPDGCQAGEGLITPTAGLGPRTKDQRQLRHLCPRWLRRTNVKLRIASIPSWATLRSCPCNRDHAPRVSMVGNLGKSQTVRLVSPPRDPQKRACNAPFANCRQIVH